MRSLSVSYIKWTGRFFYGKTKKKTYKFLVYRNLSDTVIAGFYHDTDAENAVGKSLLQPIVKKIWREKSGSIWKTGRVY